MGIDLTFCELREKEVVNIVDGKKLGRILDMVFTCPGNMLGLIVPGDKKFFKNIASNDSIFIPWKNIVRIGKDAILVELAGVCHDEKKERNSCKPCGVEIGRD